MGGLVKLVGEPIPHRMLGMKQEHPNPNPDLTLTLTLTLNLTLTLTEVAAAEAEIERVAALIEAQPLDTASGGEQ